MPVTFATVPKAFLGKINVIQRNAIRSWMRLECKAEIILFGDDPGVSETAREFGVRHIAGVAKNEYGTPLVSDLLATLQRETQTEWVCYINADIILMSDFAEALSHVTSRPGLAVGQRWDMEIENELNLQDSAWEKRLRERIKAEGRLHGKTGIDYFIFPRGLYEQIPPFAVGRTVWDNWLIYRAWAKKVPVIDLTPSVMAIHQNHDHQPGLVEQNRWKGPEAERNLALAGDLDYCFTIADADWVLKNQRLKKAGISFRRGLRYLDTLPVFMEGHKIFGPAARGILSMRRTIRKGVRMIRQSERLASGKSLEAKRG